MRLKLRSHTRTPARSIRTGRSPALLPVLWILLLLFTGCDGGSVPTSGERALVRVGESIMTVRDFHEEFESGITSPSVLYSDPEALRDEKYRALVRLTEELIIVERARILEISVSDEEVARAVQDFKQDFPDDTFEATLLENGISYLLWEKGLRRRLLLEKVIKKDISDDAFQVPQPAKEPAPAEAESTDKAAVPETETGDVEASPEMAAPADAGEESAAASDIASLPDAGTSAVIPTLPGNIGESEYNTWIEGLRTQYPIEIDWDLWEKIEKEDTTS